MNSTTVLTTDLHGHPVWADVGWPACEERLVTVTNWPMLAESAVTMPTCGGPRK